MYTTNNISMSDDRSQEALRLKALALRGFVDIFGDALLVKTTKSEGVNDHAHDKPKQNAYKTTQVHILFSRKNKI